MVGAREDKLPDERLSDVPDTRAFEGTLQVVQASPPKRQGPGRAPTIVRWLALATVLALFLAPLIASLPLLIVTIFSSAIVFRPRYPDTWSGESTVRVTPNGIQVGDRAVIPAASIDQAFLQPRGEEQLPTIRCLDRQGEILFEAEVEDDDGTALLHALGRNVHQRRITFPLTSPLAATSRADADGEAQKRLRVAAQATASPRLRIALETVADPEADDVAINDMLASFDREA